MTAPREVDGIRATAIFAASAVPPTYSPEQKAQMADGFGINGFAYVADFPAIVDAVFRAIDFPALLAAHAEAEAERERLQAVLQNLVTAHDGYRLGLGPCHCAAHEDARDTLLRNTGERHL